MIFYCPVTITNLRLIRDVSHFRSVSKAARQNHVSQSAASQAIQELERSLGVALFDRSTRPLTITAAGRLYCDYCRDILRRHDELVSSLQLLKKQTNGTVRLAAIYSVGLSEMAGIEARFRQLYPEADLQVSYLRPERVWEAVENGSADLGLMSYAESSREIVALPWRNEEMVVAVAADHALARRETVRPSQLEGEAFVGFDDDLPIQAQIARYLREHKVSVTVALHFDNLEMIKAAVAHGAGISIMPQRVMNEDVAQGRMAALHLDPAELYRPVRIIHRRKKLFSEVGNGLLTLLQEEKAHAA